MQLAFLEVPVVDPCLEGSGSVLSRDDVKSIKAARMRFLGL